MQRPATFASLLAKPDPTNWDTITYTYDPAGRRIKKNVVGSYIVKYVYDGGHVIAEYDDSGLLRKYIYGARVDEPVCMLENPASDGIDMAANNAAYYYHFDGLGSVVALSNSNGDSCQSYEYSAYGQVAASDPDFLANPYMFTGRRFDIETGLYYYRARYYNPHIGRFMQTDPVGYGAGINWYSYCSNNPLNCVDPSGLIRVAFYDPTFEIYDSNYNVVDETLQMEAWADDTYFFFSIAMLSSQDVIDQLEGLIESGYDITEVFFFDHSVGGSGPYGRLDGLQLGDETLYFDDGGLEEFFTEMKNILGEGIEYHFRNCYLGHPMNDDRLTSLATWTEGTVTGAVGHVFSYVKQDENGQWSEHMTINPLDKAIVDLPDYYSPWGWGYRKAEYNPGGSVVISSYSRPVNFGWGRPNLTY